MIKKTLCFSNSAYLSLKNSQLVIKLPEHGDVGILCITDKQFGEIEIYHAAKQKKTPTPC